MSTRRRLLPWLPVLAAVLLTTWWGVDTFVLSEGLPGGGEEGAGLIERVTRSEAEDAEGERKAPVADTTGRPPVRLQGADSRSDADADATLEVEAAARLAAGGGTTVPPEDEEIVTSGDLRPGTTRGRRGDDVLVGNTGSTPDDDEVWVRPGFAWIGTPQKQVEGLLGTRVENVPLGIRYEAPRHSVEMEGYWIERTEVTNRRYHRFLLEAAGVDFTTPFGEARTPVEIVIALVGPRAPLGWNVEATARQLVEANLAAVHAAVPELVVHDPATRDLDPEATWEGIRDAELPSGLRMRFYDRAPPAHWPDERFTAGRADHPARGLSLEDATAFALWAGRHVPSELEWEYAARGTRGLDFPWGDGARRFEDLVNGGRVLDHDEVPDTVTVRSFLDGASWVGALNLLGNVAEWTSSRLAPYPESRLAALDGVVYRGGSAADEEWLVVRPAFRGWVPLSEEDTGPPAWNRTRPWVGVRLARYEEPVRSCTVAMHTRYRATGVLPEDALEPRVFAGAQGDLDRRAFGRRQDPTVRPGVKSVVVQPLRYAVLPAASSSGHHVPRAVTDDQRLEQLSGEYFVAFGLLHVDLQILDAYAVELRQGRKPRLRRRACPPGTWLVGLHQGYLALVDPAGSTLYYLSRSPVGRATVGIHRRTPRRDGSPHLAASLTSPRQPPKVEAALELPLGNEAFPELVVRVRFDLRFEIDVLRVIRDWEAGALEK